MPHTVLTPYVIRKRLDQHMSRLDTIHISLLQGSVTTAFRETHFMCESLSASHIIIVVPKKPSKLRFSATLNVDRPQMHWWTILASQLGPAQIHVQLPLGPALRSIHLLLGVLGFRMYSISPSAQNKGFELVRLQPPLFALAHCFPKFPLHHRIRRFIRQAKKVALLKISTMEPHPKEHVHWHLSFLRHLKDSSRCRRRHQTCCRHLGLESQPYGYSGQP